MWVHAGHLFERFERSGIRKGLRSLDYLLAIQSSEGENPNRVFNGLAQLFNHLCSRVAACPISSILLISSTSTSPPPVPWALAFEMSSLLRYSTISSLFTLLSFELPLLPEVLRESGLYLPTPGISLAKAAEAAAVIEFE
jgi:hypothetical protein